MRKVLIRGEFGGLDNETKPSPIPSAIESIGLRARGTCQYSFPCVIAPSRPIFALVGREVRQKDRVPRRYGI